MVNPDTWTRLRPDGQAEFQSLFRQFQQSLRAHGVHDGWDLGTDWSVVESDGVFVISNGDAELDGVSSSRKDVIEALFSDGVANLNR
jgi:hypothetical protein